MANFKNTFYDFITGKQTVPASSDKTGTISTNGIQVTGVGTAFTSEMPTGSWLVDLSNDEIRKVIRLDVDDSDTIAYLNEPFSSDIAGGTTPNVILNSELGISEISLQIPSGQANGEIDGKTFVPGVGVTFGKSGREKSADRDLIDPVIVDATGTQMLIIIIR